MRAVVDSDTCTGCGLCADTCPEIFKLDESIAVTLVDEVPAGRQDCARQAAEECPVNAITIED